MQMYIKMAINRYRYVNIWPGHSQAVFTHKPLTGFCWGSGG